MRSLNSSVFRWPNREEVDRAAREWAAEIAKQHTGVIRVGYFGSYARGNWGVGSDLDLVAIVSRTDEPFEKRSLGWDVDELPVPAQLLVYTASEWESLQNDKGRFARALASETVWVFHADRNS
ncbi:nucleotidyltransferase domain-containing protein [Thermodesulfobacteriota bacterium]